MSTVLYGRQTRDTNRLQDNGDSKRFGISHGVEAVVESSSKCVSFNSSRLAGLTVGLGILFAAPYGMLAESRGRRLVLTIFCAGMLLSDIWTKLICMSSTCDTAALSRMTTRRVRLTCHTYRLLCRRCSSAFDSRRPCYTDHWGWRAGWGIHNIHHTGRHCTRDREVSIASIL
jgi:hypothetical protein